MLSHSSLVAFMAALLTQQALTSPVPADGIPVSNGPDMSCFNTWETVTSPPVVQYWYMQVPNNGVPYGGAKADRMWNHLNLNGCAPTENKIHTNDTFTAITFHTSSACTAQRVSNAYRSSTSPPVNIACQFTDAQGDWSAGPITAVEAAIDGLFEAAPH